MFLVKGESFEATVDVVLKSVSGVVTFVATSPFAVERLDLVDVVDWSLTWTSGLIVSQDFEAFVVGYEGHVPIFSSGFSRSESPHSLVSLLLQSS